VAHAQARGKQVRVFDARRFEHDKCPVLSRTSGNLKVCSSDPIEVEQRCGWHRCKELANVPLQQRAIARSANSTPGTDAAEPVPRFPLPVEDDFLKHDRRLRGCLSRKEPRIDRPVLQVLHELTPWLVITNASNRGGSPTKIRQDCQDVAARTACKTLLGRVPID